MTFQEIQGALILAIRRRDRDGARRALEDSLALRFRMPTQVKKLHEDATAAFPDLFT